MFLKDDAQKFADKTDKEVIYECEVKNPQKAAYSCCSTYDIAYFWENSGNCKTMIPPTGTYYCDAVKLIKRIK